jgi:hypothetical protein
MANVRTIHVDWYSQRPPRFDGGPQLAYQGDHLSNMVIFDNAPGLPNYYLLVEMKTDDEGPVTALPAIQLEGPYWVIPNYYTQICQIITYQVCCKTGTNDFEHHSAKFEGTILPVIKHNGEPIDQSPMFDPYIDILDKRVNELVVAAGDIQIDSELKIDSTNPVQNKAIAVAIKTVRSFVVEVPGSAAAFSGSIAAGDFAKALATYTAGSGVYAVKDGEVYQLSAASSSTMTFTQMYHGTMDFIKQIQITSADTFTVTNTALSSSAADTSYNNTTSGLTATDVQAAIDENAVAINGVNGRLTEYAEGIDNLTMRPSEAAELLSIARGEGGS